MLILTATILIFIANFNYSIGSWNKSDDFKYLVLKMEVKYVMKHFASYKTVDTLASTKWK